MHVPSQTQQTDQEALPAPVRVEDSGTGVESLKCEVCETRRPDGAWADTNLSHCRTCHWSWNRKTRQAHCATCHEHFTTPGNFDAHLAPVNFPGACCRPPGAVVSKDGTPKLRLRDDGVWCGAGEYDRDAA